MSVDVSHVNQSKNNNQILGTGTTNGKFCLVPSFCSRMSAADRCPGNCLKALRLDSFSTDLTGAVFPEFYPRQCPVLPHLFRFTHRISFDSKCLMSKYYRQSRSLQESPGIPKGRLHALHGLTWLARERVQELLVIFTFFVRSWWSIRKLPKTTGKNQPIRGHWYGRTKRGRTTPPLIYSMIPALSPQEFPLFLLWLSFPS